MSPWILPPVLAVHIADGVLTPAWCAGGFALLACLVAVAARGVPGDEEIVRIALLTSAFFVGSLIHVRVGPTSVHLLLNGLVGVLLGRRAALALATALFLQATLLGHGGMSTLGVNGCVLTLPALLAAGLFAVLHRPTWLGKPSYRAALVGSAVVVWSLALAFSVVLLVSNRFSLGDSLDPTLAFHATFRPATLGSVAGAAAACAWLERRSGHAPEFPLGLLLGLVSVLSTTFLNALVLSWGGAEDWGSLILLVFVAHLPVAVVEGLILGFTLGFLARVKPELLGAAAGPAVEMPEPVAAPAAGGPSCTPPALLLALLAFLGTPGAARAHRLDADYRTLADGTVEVECWFNLGGEPPRGARVEVFRGDDSLLAAGKVDAKGCFRFRRDGPQALRVVVNAGAGHRVEIPIAGHAASSERRNGDGNLTRVAAGVGVILTAAGLAIGLRRARVCSRSGERGA